MVPEWILTDPYVRMIRIPIVATPSGIQINTTVPVDYTCSQLVRMQLSDHHNVVSSKHPSATSHN